jgi:hypothetical protein
VVGCGARCPALGPVVMRASLPMSGALPEVEEEKKLMKKIMLNKKCRNILKNVENVNETFLKNVGFNIFVYTNVGAIFPKMLGQLFIKMLVQLLS